MILRQPVTTLHEQPSNGRPGQITSMFAFSVLDAVPALEKIRAACAQQLVREHLSGATTRANGIRFNLRKFDVIRIKLRKSLPMLNAPLLHRCLLKAYARGRVHVPAK